MKLSSKRIHSLTKFPAWLYFSFWAITSATFLHLGFNAFERTHLSNSVSPIIMSFFKHALAISTCHSTSYALVFSLHELKISVKQRYFCSMIVTILFLCFSPNDPEVFVIGSLVHLFSKLFSGMFYFDQELGEHKKISSLVVTITLCLILSFSWYFLVGTLLLIFVGEHFFRERIICTTIHLAVQSSMFLVGGKTKFFPVLVLLVSLLTSLYWAGSAATFGHVASVSWNPHSSEENFKNLLPLTSQKKKVFAELKEKKGGRFIIFAVGLGGTVLFQNYFRLTTFDHVKAFLYIAVSWLANLTLLRACDDLGIFNFVLGNVIVGCTVSQFGLGSTTWIAYCASLFLYGLRLGLQSVIFVSKEGRETKVYVWKNKAN